MVPAFEAEALAGTIEDDGKGTAGDQLRVELLERSGGSVTGVGEEGIARLGALLVKLGEGVAGEVDLAADLEELGSASQRLGEGAEGAEVLGDVVAGFPVAPGGAEDEAPFLVAEADGDTVDLRLDHEAVGGGEEVLGHPFGEFADLFLGIGVVEAEHRLGVADRGELGKRLAADPLAGGIGGDQLGMSGFQVDEFLHQEVVFAVGSEGGGLLIIGAIEGGDLFGESAMALGGLFFHLTAGWEVFCGCLRPGVENTEISRMKSNGFYTLGIEGGGTKTTWALIDAAGTVVREGKTTAGNVSHLDDAQLAAMLGSIHAEAGLEVGAVGGAFAGCHLEPERKRVEVILRQLWPELGEVKIGEDTMSAFAGAHGRGDGLIVIAGTGSNVQGHKGGRWEKAGGWGSLFGDPGSAYDISRSAMVAAYLHFDKTQEVTALGHGFLRRTGQNTMAEMVQPLLECAPNKTQVAAFCPVVLEAAKAGDKLAKEVIVERAGVLADRVLYVTRRLGLKKPNIGLVGGLFEKEPVYFRLFERLVRARVAAGKIFVSRTPGAVGAARMVHPGPIVEKPAVAAKAPVSKISYASATTEERNPRSRHLDKKSVAELVDLFVDEEAEVRKALRAARPQLVTAATAVAKALKAGHHLFYAGAGTSGRLGVLDASEMPPTFGVSPELVQGIIAGGSEALVRSQEGAEDNAVAGADAVADRGVGKGDVFIGITASGTAPFVRGALEEARKRGATPFLLTCNPHHPPVKGAKSIVLATGPELITGSTRLKAGTATKLALNLFSSIGMIRSGRVKDNLMINVQATNAKLRDRAKRLVMVLAEVGDAEALKRLEKNGWNVAKAAGR